MHIKDKVTVWLENETVPVQTLKKQGSLDSQYDLKSKNTVASDIQPKSNTENPKKLSRSQSENHKNVEQQVFTRSFSHTKNMTSLVQESKPNDAETQLELSSLKHTKCEEKQKPQTHPKQSKVGRLPKSKTETAISSKHNPRSRGSIYALQACKIYFL
ncbi:hypothetical protein QYM36_012749 [Artemia franciscana]|uniref:Uncharacterized protein n=1 Tax=Artemia franciscana TaxID=6661 RepID=A0AA88KY05_ARTSF|nr:hypothetical protein QYM36_012749 [Artemia franciscana]